MRHRPAIVALGLIVAVLIVTMVSRTPSISVRAGSAPAWLLQANERERESSALPSRYQQIASPAQIARYASQLFNGRPQLDDQAQQAADLFQCVDPTRALFENFAYQYNRTFKEGNEEKLERLNLFVTTLRRSIMINRIIQDAILNATNYVSKPEIRNYHFIAPTTSSQNIALWYADITDCELGLIKYILFDIFYLIDNNEYAMAYKIATDNSEYLPLLDEEGFEQLANILLVRLYDRFRGDEKMNQLFQWPLYLKKLAGYAYNRRQLAQPDFNSKLSILVYAYPSYFKDLKYNVYAINRTGDNIRAHSEHEKFNKILGRKTNNIQMKNKRLVVFRQHWTLVNSLNDDNKKWQNLTTKPDWLRLQYADSTGYGALISEKLRAGSSQDSAGSQDAEFGGSAYSEARFKHTQFSDLTDLEFVAFLTNDLSLLDNKESREFIQANFNVRPLDEKLRNEIAAELELRKTSQLLHLKQQDQQSDRPMRQRDTFELSRKVVDELISDVGLPIGPVYVEDIREDEYHSVFNKLMQTFGKSYADGRASSVRNARLSQFESTVDESAIIDERKSRYEQFKINYGRFKAWFIKEGWHLDEQQLLAMLRLADMSWEEIKLSLFKICCLTEENLASLGAQNATIQYLGSNDFMCQQLTGSDGEEQTLFTSSGNQVSQEQPNNAEQQELTALELYYYYCVHFNKHHLDLFSFTKRFAIFRHNVDRIRWHSCTRGLTLYRSLKMKNFDSLSTIDVLDPRRSYMDDINLDRYEYFTVPNLNSASSNSANERIDYNTYERLRSSLVDSNADETTLLNSERHSSPSRAGVSYRREAFFTGLLKRPELLSSQSSQRRQPGRSFAERLTSASLNNNLYALKYRRNSVHRIYDLVMQRYRFCMRNVRNIELTGNERQQCHSNGPLGDQAANGWDNQLGSAHKLQQQDQCAFYRQGLEPWAEGLIGQDLLSAQLIQNARC